MADRIDHAAEARAVLSRSAALDPGEDIPLMEALVLAQTLATLAVAEQLRIANLVSIAGLDWRRGPSAAQHASSWLVDEVGDLLPDIAAALGIEP